MHQRLPHNRRTASEDFFPLPFFASTSVYSMVGNYFNHCQKMVFLYQLPSRHQANRHKNLLLRKTRRINSQGMAGAIADPHAIPLERIRKYCSRLARKSGSRDNLLSRCAQRTRSSREVNAIFSVASCVPAAAGPPGQRVVRATHVGNLLRTDTAPFCDYSIFENAIVSCAVCSCRDAI